MLEPGDDAPDFSLPNQDDETVTLSEIDSEYTVVYFYPRADTPGCTTQACSFRDDWDAYEAAGVAVVGISDDPVSDLTAFREKYDLPFDLLSDEDGEVSTIYSSFGEKNVFGNQVMGVFRNTFVVNDDGEVVAVYEGVDPEEHAVEILSNLELA
jgi:peroxiredoxin Q/BCP